MKEITREQINAWNRMREALKGTNRYAMFNLLHEYLYGKKWNGLGMGGIREHRIEHPSDRFYIKKIKNCTYIYWEDCSGDKERWYLGTDLAKAYFGVEQDKIQL